MFLLDTNVLSRCAARTHRGDPNVAARAASARARDQFISIITLHELERGVPLAERRGPRQGAVLRAWLGTVVPAFTGRIFPVDEAVGLRAAALHVPDPQPVNDALIAATALVHRLTVVTQNTADFAPMGVRLLNP